MNIALNIAKQSFSQDEVPVGAVIIERKTGNIISSSGNEVEQLNDPCAHAEILAIRRANAAQNAKLLEGYDIYVTLEPCPMCAHAISLARLDRLYYGAIDPKSGGVDSGPRVLSSPSAHHKPEVYGGIMEIECGKLLKQFFSGKRKTAT